MSNSNSKLAVITGGSSGIGRELAIQFAKHNWNLAINYAGNKTGAEEVKAIVEDLGQEIVIAKCDVGNESEVEQFLTLVEEHYQTAPDLTVNNAGRQTWSPLLDLKVKDWDNVIATNLKGCFLFTQKAAALLTKYDKTGSIVNIGSGCNKVPFPNLVDYTASKGGIELLTRSAAMELGKYGIRVNCVAPGAIEIERTRLEDPTYAETWSKAAPLNRVGTPEDIFYAVEFLASDNASYITGQTIWVDGGAFTKPNWPEVYRETDD